MVVVAPGPWNEIEEIAKSRALREAARGPWAHGSRSRRMAFPHFEVWMAAQPASELTLLALRCLHWRSYC